MRNQLDTCQLLDMARLRQKIRELEKHPGRGDSYRRNLDALTSAISKSQHAVQQRIAAIPTQIDYPAALPISAAAEKISRLIDSHQVVVVAGDTGSGKTTQIPKMCLAAGLGRLGLIGHTQPRRLAAVSVANRIAEELHCELGRGVGYQVRFNETLSSGTYLKLMTDGILLAEIQQDRFLNKYEALIIDEAHERSLNIDFLLGFLKQLLSRRKDLKLIITSATIDVEKFAAHFDDAPVVSVSGRAYPIKTQYRPLNVSKAEMTDEDLQIDAIVSALQGIIISDRQHKRISGDVLVFLSSEREIRDTANKLRKQKFVDTDILPLYARLRHSEQLRVFRAHQGRRIVLATNVAETSITVPGINYVIDTGLARISRYSFQSKVQRLPIEPISQASANQRQGRCGRLAEGICIRLYSEEDFNSRDEFTDPEIMRTNLASVILRMKQLKLGDVELFPFLEPPGQKAINEGFKLLIELNALNPKRELTDCGKKMAQLPVDPRYARMIVLAHEQGCLREILIIVSALSIQDPRELSLENRQQATQKLARFQHVDSDFLGFVNLWDQYERERQDLTQGQLKKYCKTNCLSYMRMREWREVHRQLLLGSQHLGFRVNKDSAEYQSIHQSIIGGALNQIACKAEGKMYVGSRNRKFSLFSSSVLSGSHRKWIVTSALIEISQTFATLAAKIQPHWVEQMALHLVKRNYFEPHWSKKRQQVMAYEKVYLYGLVLLQRELVSFKKIDPVAAREIFIDAGIVADQLLTEAAFYKHNMEFLAELKRLEEKIRRPDYFISEREVTRFYDDRLPADVCSTRDLERWLKTESRNTSKLLEMSLQNLTDSATEISDFDEFPDLASVHQNQLALNYVFDPGTLADGATIEVPLALLNQLTQAEVDWSVPGIIRQKCIALIKGLPKSVRKNFIPASGFVAEIMGQMHSSDGELIDSLLTQIRKLKKLKIDREVLTAVVLPAHLKVKVRVVDESGTELAFGDDLAQIKQELKLSPDSVSVANRESSYRHELEVQGLTDWNFDELPVTVEIGDSLVLIRYPALVDKIDAVNLELLADRSEAQLATIKGVVRLCMFRSVQQKNSIQKKFTRFVKANALKWSSQLTGLAQAAVVESYIAAFDLNQSLPRSNSEFEALLEYGKPRILGVADQIEQLLILIVTEHFSLSRRLQNISNAELEYLTDDIDSQLQNLVFEGFLSTSGLEHLREYPRYFQAVNSRLEKMPHMGEKDRVHTVQLAQYWEKYETLQGHRLENECPELNLLRWMLEEFRVSLFAQALGTRIPVSAKRIDAQFEKLLS